jgi:rhodanese-related sulfurtransferase
MVAKPWGRQEAGEPYRRINSDDAKVILEENGGDVVIVDVRRQDEWDTGHVAGAVHIPVDDLLGRFGELPEDKELLFICAAGVRSGLAAEMAAAMGAASERLYNIEDGTPTWLAKGYPSE